MMEIMKEEFMFAGTDQVDDVLMEAWLIPSEESLKEFEDYLADLGLRF